MGVGATVPHCSDGGRWGGWHVTVLCLIIYLGYMVSQAIWHTEFVFFKGCPGGFG